MPKLLRLTSLVCCAFVLASFFLFALAQSQHASQGQTSALSAGTATAAAGTPHVRPEAQPRRFIDAVAQKLDSPFTGVVSSDNAWVRRGLPTLIALLVYGFLLGFLARWTAARPA